MFFWNKLRTPILALTLGSTLLVLGKSLVAPATEKARANSFAFPAQVLLPGWQALGSHIPTEPGEDSPSEGRSYEYRQDGTTMAIAMHYVAHLHPNETLFREYDPSLSSAGETVPILRSTPETGSYSLSVKEERAYLRACINPRGPSAITYEQFIKNRYTYDLQFNRLWPVLLGQEPLRDYRCLWTHLSIPADKVDPDSAYQVLEQAWPSWYQWWHSHFPKL